MYEIFIWVKPPPHQHCLSKAFTSSVIQNMTILDSSITFVVCCYFLQGKSYESVSGGRVQLRPFRGHQDGSAARTSVKMNRTLCTHSIEPSAVIACSHCISVAVTAVCMKLYRKQTNVSCKNRHTTLL